MLIFGRPFVQMLSTWREVVQKHCEARKLNREDAVPGLLVPKTFRSQERIVLLGNFRSGDFSFPARELSFPGPFILWNFHSRGMKILGTFVPWTFRSEELSFPGLFVPRNFCSSDYFYEALAMNVDSYSNCQNLFPGSPSSVCFPKIN